MSTQNFQFLNLIHVDTYQALEHLYTRNDLWFYLTKAQWLMFISSLGLFSCQWLKICLVASKQLFWKKLVNISRGFISQIVGRIKNKGVRIANGKDILWPRQGGTRMTDYDRRLWDLKIWSVYQGIGVLKINGIISRTNQEIFLIIKVIYIENKICTVFIYLFLETTLSPNVKLEHISELKEVVGQEQFPARVSHLVSEIGPSKFSFCVKCITTLVHRSRSTLVVCATDFVKYDTAHTHK